MRVKKVPPAVNRLVRYLLTYESDTFSASGWKLTQAQAEAMANKIIDDDMDSLDGIALTEYLARVKRL